MHAHLYDRQTNQQKAYGKKDVYDFIQNEGKLTIKYHIQTSTYNYLLKRCLHT